MNFNPETPIESAATPPATWYLDPEVLQTEKDQIFSKSWQPVGRLDQLQRPGDFITGDLLGKPYLVIRDKTGQLRAFYNVCRHHAAGILKGEGCAQQLVCPYHGWTYDLDGSLKSAPRMAGARDFASQDYGLFPIAVAIWKSFVWIHFGKDRSSLAEDLSELGQRLGDVSRLKFHSRRSYEIACNWKVYVDNYLDGGYHVPVLHGSLSSQLSLSSYKTEIFDKYSIQSCKARETATERIGDGALYAWIYPGFMINRYGPVMDTNWIVPLSHDRTLTVFDFYFEETESKAFIESSMQTSERVQQEDVSISESVQRGLASGAYRTGRYAPSLEQGEHHFHRLLARDLKPGV